MIALLFTLIVIHFSITLVLLIRYTALKKEVSTGSVKREIYSVMREFNAQAERNIQILEDRIQKFQQLSQEATKDPKKLSSLSSQGESHSGASLLSFLKEEKLKKEKLNEIKLKEIKLKEEKKKNTAKNLAKQSKEQNWSNSRSKTKVPSLEDTSFLAQSESMYYIQEMYKQSQAKKTQKIDNRLDNKMDRLKSGDFQRSKNLQNKDLQSKNFESKDLQSKNLEDSKVSSILQVEGQSTDESFSAKELPSKTKNQIARLIGEGKSYEEIAEILGLSLSEIRLFVSILRKKILDSAPVS